MARPRTGLMIIRAWVEPGSVAPLRAHVRRTDELGVTEQFTTTLTDVDAVGALVEAWLHNVLRGGPHSRHDRGSPQSRGGDGSVPTR